MQKCSRSLREAMAATTATAVAVVVASEAVVATTMEVGVEEGVNFLMLRVVAHVAEEDQEKSLRPFYPINEVDLVQFFRKFVQMFCR